MLRVGLIGLGTVSYIHKLAIESNELGSIVAVSDIDTATKKEYEGIPFYEDFEEMLKNGNLDVVHICLPHDLHVPITKKCIEYDAHVFLEKPLAMDYAEALTLNKITKNSDKKVGLCFQNRYNNTTRELLHRLADSPKEVVGEVKAVKGVVTWFRPESYYEAQPWRGELNRAGGGTITNQSIHTIDLMGLFGGPVQACKGKLMNLSDYDIEVEDTAAANYEFSNDTSGLYFATNVYANNSSVELEVITTKKRYLIKENQLIEYSHTNEDGKVLVQDEIFESTKSYYGYGHKMAIETFYQAIKDDTKEYITIEDSLNSVLMVDLLKESSKQNKKIDKEEIIKNEQA